MALILTLFFTTFILEDVALASALALISQGKIHFVEGFLACSLGIAIGDIGLYFLGRFAHKNSYFKQKIDSPQFKDFFIKLSNNKKMDMAIIISRAIPGTRLPTYLAAGVMKYSIHRFFILTVLSVSAWVFASLYFGQAFFSLFKGQWIWALLFFLVILSVLKKILILANDRWKLKATLQAWRKWLHFEFWPAWFFYLPIIPYYVFLSIRYRSLLIPFYANPNVKHGGLIGESKWAFLKFLDSASPATLSATFLNHGLASSEVRAQLNANKICFPMVAKPDVGQRGFAVRILKNEAELFSYLDLSESDVIAQQKSKYTSEAGVFYLRYPSQKQGQIFSITDKKFPFVIGDGQTRLGDLILQDSRARIIAGTYFSRHQDSLDTVIAKDEKYFLSECGNHCQGAIFLNGAHLATTELLSAIEKIAQKIPDFYFGRIDIRYQDENSLKKGLHFEIIEVNGAGSEATHIWDAKTNLIEAYRVLFAQWEHLFAIGAELKKTGKSRKPECLEFILDCIKVYFRKGPLTTSS